jgi:hypothetical protein
MPTREAYRDQASGLSRPIVANPNPNLYIPKPSIHLFSYRSRDYISRHFHISIFKIKISPSNKAHREGCNCTYPLFIPRPLKGRPLDLHPSQGVEGGLTLLNDLFIKDH